jgi:peptide/nickel transport system permease protein
VHHASYIASRSWQALLTLWAVATMVFLAIRAAPGDPVDSILGENATVAARAQLTECLRLDRHVVAQYVAFLGDVADGTLGRYCDNPDVTVSSRLLEVVPHTAELAVTSVALALLMAIPLGALAARRQGSWVDVLALLIAMVGVSIPSFWLGPMLLLLLSIALRVFPDPGSGVMGLNALVLPAFTLALALAAKLTRMTRNSLLEVLSSDYVRTARAKGLTERVVVFKHAMRNAMIPVVTVTGLQLGALLSGSIIIEKVFARPGLGTLLLDGIEQRNYMQVQGCVLAIAFTYVVINLVTDLIYVAVDPRISLSRAGNP